MVGAFAGLAVHEVRIVAAVGDYDVRIAVAVQVGQCHITRSPVRAAECTGLGEVSFAVIQVDKLAIRRIAESRFRPPKIPGGQSRIAYSFCDSWPGNKAPPLSWMSPKLLQILPVAARTGGAAVLQMIY